MKVTFFLCIITLVCITKILMFFPLKNVFFNLILYGKKNLNLVI